MALTNVPLKNQYGLRDLTSVRFGKLVVQFATAKKEKGKTLWNCLCDCGTVVVVRHDYLLHTHSPKTHCGCKNRGPSVTHKLEYSCFLMMHIRCEDPNHVAYKHYGGRGIKVCDQWSRTPDGFAQFVRDMGARPSIKYTLDRTRVNGNYEPGNVTWATGKTQGRNKRGSLFLPHPKTGAPVPAAEVAEYLGVSYQVMRARYIKEGKWPGIATQEDPIK